MSSSPLRKSPPALFLLAVCCFLVTLLSRGLFPMEEPPAFSSQKQKNIYLEISGEGILPGIRQFSDENARLTANKLTEALGGPSLVMLHPQSFQVVSGEKFSVVKKGRQIKLVQLGWIPSAQRMALGIPLHPERMERDDWTALPGIGDTLAERIEMNRQKNGDFGSLASLKRVKGIGKKRVEKWRKFF